MLGEEGAQSGGVEQERGSLGEAGKAHVRDKMGSPILGNLEVFSYLPYCTYPPISFYTISSVDI